MATEGQGARPANREQFCVRNCIRSDRRGGFSPRPPRSVFSSSSRKAIIMLTELTNREGTQEARPQTSTMSFGPRRGVYINAAERVAEEGEPLDAVALDHCDTLDLFYRTLCAAMYNYAPLSGHPGGSISCGRFVQRLLFETMDYDFARPNRRDADLISYAAGHKALGLYAMWALRNEIARIAAPELLPADERCKLRLEDLLGFRRNPTTTTPLFRKFHAKPLDGHPTP